MKQVQHIYLLMRADMAQHDAERAWDIEAFPSHAQPESCSHIDQTIGTKSLELLSNMLLMHWPRRYPQSLMSHVRTALAGDCMSLLGPYLTF